MGWWINLNNIRKIQLQLLDITDYMMQITRIIDQVIDDLHEIKTATCVTFDERSESDGSYICM